MKGSVHQSPIGRQPRDSLGGNSPKGDPLGDPPFNPLIKSFGWPVPNPHMFIPPWYPLFTTQLVPELASKLPYRKLQYSTYVKDIDLDAHIKIFKKTIKVNGEIVETNIINMFGFTR
jgi:hypothetical protein